ncbi:hypothetical protein J1N35_018111 [Gossypium stocksii]|uniref:Uncharacterized protein n=1 Tax=Gossypium stocksii TaxID=47602 RepID=A0A9D3VNL0_9ROSI|nr:hypothetical protein J1N35_018111 [Gossypium stocksii]
MLTKKTSLSQIYVVEVPAYYALILKSLTVLEGLALYADPNFNVLAASYPYFSKKLLTDPNPYLRDALIELLFKDGRFRRVFSNQLIYASYFLYAFEFLKSSYLESVGYIYMSDTSGIA